MDANKSVIVLAPNGRRQTVKVTPNTTILQILEDVCKKQSYNAEEYNLKHHNKIMDSSMSFRFSGLPNNAQLEMAVSSKPRQETAVTLGLQLESGERPTGIFPPTASLWDVMQSLAPAECEPGKEPTIVYARREVVGDVQLQQTTLRSLGLTGGRAMVRLIHKTPELHGEQPNVSSPIMRPQRHDNPIRQTGSGEIMPSSVAHATENSSEIMMSVTREQWEQRLSQASTPAGAESGNNENTSLQQQRGSSSNMTWEYTEVDRLSGPLTVRSEGSMNQQEDQLNSLRVNPENNADFVILGERNAVLYNVETASPFRFNFPDDFFDHTVEDARVLYRDLKKERDQLDNAPLLTQDTREMGRVRRQMELLQRYRRAVIRIRFPDRHILQGVFRPTESIASVKQFVSQFLAQPDMEFELFTTPPKLTLDPQLRLIEVDCVPCALVHFIPKLPQPPGTVFIHNGYLTQLSTPGGAALVANQSRSMVVIPPQSVSLESMNSEKFIEQALQQQSQSSDAGSSQSRTNVKRQSQAVQSSPRVEKPGIPKWFKIGK